MHRDMQHTQKDARRPLVRLGVTVSFALALTACAGPGGGSGTGPVGTVSENNPFGVADDSVVDLVVFDGGYGTEYAENAAELAEAHLDNGTTFDLSTTTKISAELQPRFVGGTPPDVFNNDGADSIPVTSIINQLAPLDDLFETVNYDGVKIEDAVYPGVREAGTYDGKLINANYVMTAFGLWYSQSLFDELGLTPPRTWDDLDALCTSAKEVGKYLFVYGKDTGDYWSWFIFDTAVKQGGTQVITDISNLVPGAWSNPALKEALTRMKQLVDNGCFVPGGSGTDFTQAQAQWSQKGESLMYYTGSWIENEMKEVTADGFEMTYAPVPLLDESSAAMPYEAIQAGPAGFWSIPVNAANLAGGMEFLRAMFSKEAAAAFAETVLTPTVVKDTVPEDGFGSTALASVVKSMSAAGDSMFAYVPTIYRNYYGMDYLPLWAEFLSGNVTVDELIAQEEELSAAAAADPDKPHNEYDY